MKLTPAYKMHALLKCKIFCHNTFYDSVLQIRLSDPARSSIQFGDSFFQVIVFFQNVRRSDATVRRQLCLHFVDCQSWRSGSRIRLASSPPSTTPHGKRKLKKGNHATSTTHLLSMEIIEQLWQMFTSVILHLS